MLKKSISVLLAVMMLLTLVPMSALHTFAAESSEPVADGDELTISAGETKTVEITEGGQNVDYKFTPTESRSYVFYSTGSNDTYGYLLNENKNTLTSNDDGGSGNNFSFRYNCTAGVTYYVRARFYNSGTTGSFDLVCEAVPNAESVSISGSTFSGYEGTTIYLNSSFSPENCIEESLSWSSSNESVATVDNYGDVNLISAGTATITVTSENGLTDSVEVTVIGMEDITLGAIETAEAVEGDEVLYRFTPTETREYRFYSTGNATINGYLLNSNMNSFAYNYGNPNFSINYKLNANTVYYIKAVVDYANDAETFGVGVEAIPYASSMSINQGDSCTVYMLSNVGLSVSFPEGTYAENVTWASSDTNVATVYSDSGYITPKAPGTATITATSARGLTDSITVTVLGPKALTLGVTDTFERTYKGSNILYSFVAPEDGYYDFTVAGSDNKWTNLYFFDKDFNYLTGGLYQYIDEAGGTPAKLRINLTAGTYYLFSFFNNNSVEGTLSTTASTVPEATGLTITEGNSVTGYINSSINLHTAFVPENALAEDISWSSSDESVATVDGGYVQLLSTGTAVITVSTESGLSDTITVTVLDYPTIAAGETKTAEINSPGNIAYFRFTPAESGNYAFFSTSNSDTYGYLYNAANTSTLANNDDGGNNSNFRIEYYCEEGTPYLLGAKYYSTSNTGSFDVTVESIPSATAVTIDNGDIEGYVFSEYDLIASFTPSNAKAEELTWESSDSDVATVSSYGTLKLVSEGTATITVTSENGLTDSITVTVHDFEAISAGDSKTNNFGDVYFVTYKFTPESDISCEFTVSDRYDNSYNLYVLDTSFNELKYSYNNKIQYRFTGGETYYLRAYYDSVEDWFATLSLNEIPQATAISIDKGDAIMAYPHTNFYLYAAFTPYNAMEESLSWSSSDEDVAYVGDNGYVELLSEGTATITVTSDNGLSAECVITVIAPEAIAVDETKEPEMPFSGYTVMYSFTPEEDGRYKITTEGSNNYYDIYNVWYYSDFNVIASNYDNISCDLEAGETYYFAVKNDTNDALYPSVTLSLIPYAESISFAQGNSITCHPGDTKRLDIVTVPEEALVGSCEWESSDTTVASVNGLYDNSAIVEGVSIGTTEITVTTSKGLSATCTVTVTDFDSIEPGETKNVNIEEPYTNETFRFTPEESGYYAFYSSGSRDTYGYLLDEDLNQIAYDDDSGTNNNFRINKYFEAGKTYYFRARITGDRTGSFTATLEESFAATSIEILTLPDRTEYVENYVTGYINLDGLSARITWSDGETTVWDYKTSGKSRGEYVTTSTTSSDPTWVGVSCGDAETSFHVTEIENPYESIEVVSGLTTSLIENVDGYWSTNNNGDYFKYYTPNLSNVTLRVNYKDPERESFEVNYNQGVDGYSFGYSIDQYNHPWTLGSDNEMTISFLGLTTPLYVTVAENPVESLVLLSESEYEFVENYGGTTYYDTYGDPYFYYYVYYDNFSDAVIQINFTDGTSTTASPGSMVNGYSVSISDESTQGDSHWTVGGNNTYYITYMGNKVEAHATVVQDPVDHIEISYDPGLQVIENYDGYWDYRWDSETEEEVRFFYYDLSDTGNETGLDDLEVTIFYKDGTTATANIFDYVDGKRVDISTTQYSQPWTVGNNTFSVTYLNSSVDANITVVENPVESLTVIAPSEYTFVENSNGNWRQRYNHDTNEYESFYDYYTNYLKDAVVQINYKDGTSETANIYQELNGYWIDYYTDQYSKPWTVGSDNEVYITYLGAMTTMYVDVIENPVESISVLTPSTYVYTENLDGSWSNYYVNGVWQYRYFAYDLDNLEDTVIQINYKDGTTTTANIGDMVEGFEVECTNDFNDNPWTVGSSNTATVSYLGAETTLNVTVAESPVESLVVVSPPTHQYIENNDGHTEERYNPETEQYESYFRYNTYQSHFSDAVVRINYKDGTSKTANVGEYVDGEEVIYSTKQERTPWTVGSNNEVEIEYMGATVTTYVSVIENPVESIEVLNGATLTVTENLDGYWDTAYNPVTDKYDIDFFYYYTGDADSIPVRINYKDGTSVTANVFDSVGGFEISTDSDQSRHPWTVGGENFLTITYLGAETQVPVIVNPSPIESLTVTKLPSAVIYEHCNGYWDTAYNPVTESYDIDYFNYSLPSMTDCEVLIAYTDGSTQTAHVGDYIDGYEVRTYASQYNDPWSVGGNNEVTVTYMGKETTFSMPIQPNPVASITVTQDPTREYIIGEHPYFTGNWFSPTDMTGLAFTVNYTNGTSKTFTSADIDETTGKINGFSYDVSSLNNYTVGNNEATFTYMGHDATFNATIIDSPVSGITLINGPTNPNVSRYYRADLTGTTLKVNFTDGTSSTITLSDSKLTYTNDLAYFGYTATFSLKGHDGIIPLSYWGDEDDAYYRVLYAGKTCNIPVTITEETNVTSIDVENFSLTGENMVFHTYRENGTQVDVTVQKVLCNIVPNGGRMAYVLARTDKGILNFNIGIQPEYTGYDVYAFRCRYKRNVTRLLGDTNGDNRVTIDDATIIQRYLAEYRINDLQQLLATGDVDGDKKISIRDVTAIQRYLAQIEIPEGIGEPVA